MQRSNVGIPSVLRGTIFERGLDIDWPLFFSTILTVTIGILMIHSTEIGGTWHYLFKQMAAALIGLMGMIFLTLLPYQMFRNYIRATYIFMIIVLISVFIIGTNLRGTKGWFHLGPIYIQSSEVAKVLFVLSLAGYLDRRIQWYSPRSLVMPFVFALFPIVLIVAQPDFSSSLVFMPVTLVMFYFAGARTLHLLGVCLMGGLAAGIPLCSTYFLSLDLGSSEHPILYFLSLALQGGWPGLWLFLGICVTISSVWIVARKLRVYIPSLYLWVTLILIGFGTLGAMAGNKALKTYQRQRLIAFVNPDIDPLGGGYNIRQSQIAIGSGRILGKGYGRGTQSRLGFLPSRHTDFIFSVIGEELGFLQTLVVLSFYFLIVWKGFEIAMSARDRFGSLVASGFATMFAFYSILNIGMTMGLAPVAGVPLPLVSYGGSSVVSSMTAVGILLSIHWRRHLL